MSLQKTNPPDTVQVPPAVPPPEIDMPKSFTFSLDDINSVFGISADTLSALAHSHGVSEQELIIRAVTQLARAEIPDLDLDAPRLSPEQVAQLMQRRVKLEESRQSNGANLKDVFLDLLSEQGDADADDSRPQHGGHT
ncbi:hypothetical protein [Noviherbaspirillum galbum]|uniref:Uncharacterized protein n=1 Tax=Noviherbaspirillum galbum TaxID=2709383 RepID=A0A6B3SVJ9_9BURK|nr:hypothetical protein [Noviherbaspirillum galbum]NEX63415.1 hypothetical protein [Noviherbaspirillum galbum]